MLGLLLAWSLLCCWCCSVLKTQCLSGFGCVSFLGGVVACFCDTELIIIHEERGSWAENSPPWKQQTEKNLSVKAPLCLSLHLVQKHLFRFSFMVLLFSCSGGCCWSVCFVVIVVVIAIVVLLFVVFGFWVTCVCVTFSFVGLRFWLVSLFDGWLMVEMCPSWCGLFLFDLVVAVAAWCCFCLLLISLGFDGGETNCCRVLVVCGLGTAHSHDLTSQFLSHVWSYYVDPNAR